MQQQQQQQSNAERRTPLAIANVGVQSLRILNISPKRMKFALEIHCALLLTTVSKAVSECLFPIEWRGEWYEGGSGGITISATNISRKGVCVETEQEFYLLRNSELDCGLCLAIQQRHSNALQYKESFCVGMDSLRSICSTMHGQTLLRTLLRESGRPSGCPFHDAYHFVYSNNSGGFCRNPVSYVRPCSSSSLLRFHFKHCSDAAYTYDIALDVECWALWRDGAKTFLIGRLNPKQTDRATIVGDQRYRCFIYRIQGSVVQLSMSADASCRGLISSSNGPIVMELTADVFGWPKAQCTYPAFVTRNLWRDLAGSRVYRANSMGDVVEGLGTSLSAYNSTPSHLQEVVEVWLCHTLLDRNTSSDRFVAIAFVLRDCFSSYRCTKFEKKTDGVLELTQGNEWNFAKNDQCLSQTAFSKERRLLLSGITPRACPLEGRFLIHTGSDVRSSYFRSGCNVSSVIDITSTCSSKSGFQLECLKKWKDDKLRYLAARTLNDVDGAINCFTFRKKGETLLFSLDVTCNGETPSLLRDSITYVLDKQPRNCDNVKSLPTGQDVVHDSLQVLDRVDSEDDVISGKDVRQRAGSADDVRRSRDYHTSDANADIGKNRTFVAALTLAFLSVRRWHY